MHVVAVTDEHTELVDDADDFTQRMVTGGVGQEITKFQVY